MKTNALSQKGTKTKGAKKNVVAAIGRWMPIHEGHKRFLLKLANDANFSKVIVMIGSCYQGGDARHCITATEREKMLRAIFKRAGIPDKKISYVPIPDFPTFEEWIETVLIACKKHKVTHFCTGNREEILDVLEADGDTYGLELINPEEDSDFPYHATDIRNMIINGDYEKLEGLIPDEVKPILFRNTFKEIIATSTKRGIRFVAGRQTTDMVLLVSNVTDGKIYVLLGKRPKTKKDFPGVLALPGGGIKEYETTVHAVKRIFYKETGLKIQIVDNSLEPAIVRFKGLENKLEQMYMVGVYGTEDKKLNGTRGGSSQCFAILVEGDVKDYASMIQESKGLTDVKFYDIEKISKKQLAYQHGEMIKKAVNMLEAYPDLQEKIAKKEEKKETLVISFVGAPGVGKSTAALGTAYSLKSVGLSVEYVDEFTKGLVYTDLLERYIPNQSYIISEQYKRIYDLLGKVDYIVSDAGLEISALHSSGEKVIEDLAWYLTGKINQFTILIERDPRIKYDEEGRVEDEEESRAFGERLEQYLQENGANYVKVVGSDEAVKKALEIVEERKKNAD